LTRTPREDHSAASARVIASAAPFVAAYTLAPPRATVDISDDMVTMTPPPDAPMCPPSRPARTSGARTFSAFESASTAAHVLVQAAREA